MQLYRAVSNEEYDQLMHTRQFEATPNALEGKWFAETLDHAVRWGELFYGDQPFRVVEITLADTVAESFFRLEKLDGIGAARFATIEQLAAVEIEIQGVR